MVQIARGWDLDVERGPGWLFVRPHSLPEDAEHMPPLAEQVWALLERNFANRLVLELDQLQFLHSYLIGQLVWLQKRIHTHGGIMRICGLSPENQDVLQQCRLNNRLPLFENREAAVMGYRPSQPR